MTRKQQRKKRIKAFKERMKRGFAGTLALYMFLTSIMMFVPSTSSYALTGGPSQPEVQSFEPIGTSDMVDLFSGDFTYNIPLLDVEGYPINLAYHSGITMDQEASWTGLGWNVNVGVVNRALRGLPDDFDGEDVITETNIKKNWTFGTTVSIDDIELVGLDPKAVSGGTVSLNASLGINYNSYNGVGSSLGIGIGVSFISENGTGMSSNLGLNSSSSGGLDISPSISLSQKTSQNGNTNSKLGANVGLSFNSRIGLSSLSIGLNLTSSEKSTKKNYSSLSGSVGASGSFNLQQPTYTPKIVNSMKSFAISTRVKFGGEVFATSFGVSLGLSYSEQKLKSNILHSKSYGYFYSQDGQNDDHARHDFNRENTGSVTPFTPNLPITNYTYDILSVSGQGVGGSYRPFRGQIGHVFDYKSTNTSSTVPVTVEIGIGNLTHGGGTSGVTIIKSNTGNWKQTSPNGVSGSNQASKVFDFENKQNAPDFENVVLREANEMSVLTDPAYYEMMGKDNAVQIEIVENGDYNVATTNKIKGLHTPTTTINRNYKKGRQKRNNTIQKLNVAQVMNGMGIGGFPEHSFVNEHNAELRHHTGQIIALGSDGMRYVYGLPAYNSKQQEVTFAVSENAQKNLGEGLVSYSSNDNSIGNSQGRDNYFQRVTTKPYAHSYLLTYIVSDDYVDIDGIQGPSDGDLGSYTKFNYKRSSSVSNNDLSYDAYKWRTPTERFQASYNEGLKTESLDDKASYLYGEKELWYTESVETKNFIAVFSISNRLDGKGVQDDNGGISTNNSSNMKKLDKITLYSKPDYNAHINNLSNATPLKEVHFVYDYSLCKNISNYFNPSQPTTNEGKLTLKKVYFTYRDSKKGKLSPYEFTYSDKNPDYNHKAYDRWGNYKEPVTFSSNINYNAETDDLATYEYPYAEQDELLANEYAQSWELSSIGLPSGGEIKVTLESDDYQFVQNKKAMKMMKIVNVSGNDGNWDDSGDAVAQIDPSNVVRVSNTGHRNRSIYFEKDPNVPIEEYTKGIDDIYFRCLMQFSTIRNNYDFVSGYAKIESCVEEIVGGVPYGKITLSPVSFGDSYVADVNPIALAGIQFGRLYLPNYVWGAAPINPNATLDFQLFTALVNTLAGFIEGFTNPNWTIFQKNKGTKIILNKSWIRLNDVSQCKFGGGSRVSAIKMNDDWVTMTDSEMEDFDYGQVYSYKKKDGSSSGVASYEPQLGGDENPFKQPISFANEARWAPDERFYQETPFGESFFPSASVGYSRVVVKNLEHIGVPRNATGRVVHEFFTAKDFPTIVAKTDLVKIPHKDDPFSINSFFKVDARDYLTASQGFVVETNDMHGKPKGQSVYQENQSDPITSVEYVYQSTGYLNGANRLANKVDVLFPDGHIENREIGINFDMVADFTESYTKINTMGLSLNLDAFFVGPIPLLIPPIWPKKQKEQTLYRSATLTKVVQKFGILEKTIAKDLGSKVETSNLVYDAETGGVLLTKTKTNFEDEVFSMNYPAYWYYDQMGPAYKNIGINVIDNCNNSGVFQNARAAYFVEGDEVYMRSINNPSIRKKMWVVNANNNSFKLVDKNGSPPDVDTYLVSITRSGRRNMQSQMMASLTSLSNPMDNFKSNTYENVLQASAIEFDDEWRTYCDCFGTVASESTNPYFTGRKGNFRPKVSYLHLSDRTQSDYNNNTNLRKDGVFHSYRPYYNLNANGKWEVDRKDWTYTAEVTEFNPYGQELANEDALGRESAAQFGFNQTLAKAVAANAGYRDIGFSSFEDDDFSECADNHFKFEQRAARVNTDSHTGVYSIRATQGNSITLRRQLQRCEQSDCTLEITLIDSGSFIEIGIDGGAAPYTSNFSTISGEPVVVPTENGPQVLLQSGDNYTIEFNVLDANGCRAIEYLTVTNGVIQP